MLDTTTWRRTAALVATGAMVLSACGESAPATDVGITEEACPAAINPDNGCIYLGTLSDLTEGPFAALGGPITDAQAAFWKRVNDEGGIGGYDIDVETYVRDNKYNPEEHNRLYQEMKPDILAIAQTLGSPTTAVIIDDMTASNVVGAPASWTSALEFSPNILESGNNYCVEAANALDYHVEQGGAAATVMAVHYPGDYGDDGGAGARKWAEANSAEFTDVEQVPASLGGTTDGAIAQILEVNPDVVVLTVAPTETAQIVGGAAAQGYAGRFIGSSPTWNPALIDTPAFPALEALYWQAGPWGPWDTDTPGHTAMRDMLAAEGVETGNDGYTAGWVWSYPLKALFELAAEKGDMTRAGLVAALAELDNVDYEGMLPAEAGKFSGTPAEQAFRGTVISSPNAESDSGVSLISGDFYYGATAAEFTFEKPCYEE